MVDEDDCEIREALAGKLDDAALLETTQSAMNCYCMAGHDGWEYREIYDQIRAAIGEATFDGYVSDKPTLFDLVDAKMAPADCMRVLAILAWLTGVTEMPQKPDLEAFFAAAALVRAGKLDEAERAARDLLVRFPDKGDNGYRCLGMVYEARGDKKRAADYYRLALAYIRFHSLVDDLERRITDLDRAEPGISG